MYILLSSISAILVVAFTFFSSSPIGNELSLAFRELLGDPLKLPLPPQKPYEQPFWLVHVTDLHLSVLNPDRSRRFLRFCNETLYILNPALIVASGDLVHATTRQGESKQLIYEWRTYKSILQSTNYYTSSKWIDLPGNHDCRSDNVSPSTDPPSYYNTFSVSKTSSTSQHIIPISPQKSLQIITSNQCLKPGLRRGLSMFGRQSQSELDEFKHLLSQSYKYDHSIAFGHFPLSFIESTVTSIAAVLSNSSTSHYFCGHLHDRVGDEMHAKWHSGVLEQELYDFKRRSAFRLIVVYKGAVCTQEFTIDSVYPLHFAVVMSPQDASKRTERNLMAESDGTVDLLVFGSEKTLSSIATIEISVDSEEFSQISVKKLFLKSTVCFITIPFEFNTKGLHSMHLKLKSGSGKLLYVIPSHRFAVDGSVAAIHQPLAHLFMSISLPLFLRLSFSLSWLGFTLFLLPWLRDTANRRVRWEISSKENKSNLSAEWESNLPFPVKPLVWRMLNSVKSRHSYFAFQIVNVILIVCPIMVTTLPSSGEILVVFVWGIFHGPFLRFEGLTADTWFLGFHKFFFTILPVFFVHSFFNCDIQSYSKNIPYERRYKYVFIMTRIVLSLFIFFNELEFFSTFGSNYGYSVLLSPFFIWSDFILFAMLTIPLLFTEKYTEPRH